MASKQSSNRASAAQCGRIFLDKRVPDTMRGQAQALYQLLVGSVAGIVGSFFCEVVYQQHVTEKLSSWSVFWWALAGFTLIPLAYFFIGVIGKSSEQEQ